MGHLFESNVVLAADRAAVEAAILDMAAYPTWVDGVRAVEVRSTDASGRPIDVEFVIDTPIAPLTYTVTYDYSEDGHIRWTLDHGQALTKFDGDYHLSGTDGAVHLDARVELAINMPLPSAMIRQVGQSVIDRAITGLTRHVTKSSDGQEPS
ncbi:MAG: SRPBCC family protein [Nitriliruptoraceae bacterium]